MADKQNPTVREEVFFTIDDTICPVVQDCKAWHGLARELNEYPTEERAYMALAQVTWTHIAETHYGWHMGWLDYVKGYSTPTRMERTIVDRAVDRG